MSQKPNTVLCEDCLTNMAIFPNDFFDLIIADPPYLTTNAVWDRREVFTEEVVQEMKRILKPSGSIYVWCGIGEKSQSLMRWFPLLSAHLRFKDIITWKKQCGIGNRKGWLYTREELTWWVKDNKQFVWRKDNQYSDVPRAGQDFSFQNIEKGYKNKSKNYRWTNVWEDIPEVKWQRGPKKPWLYHKTSKPKKAIARIVEAHTYEGDKVYDPFMGSGTTAVVCQSLGREWYGCDINEEYVEMTRHRLEVDGVKERK